MGLIELIVAMTILSVGVLGLAGAATFAQRSFASAEAIELGAEAAAEVIDSLLREPRPVTGARQIGIAHVSWTVRSEPGITRTFGADIVPAIAD